LGAVPSIRGEGGTESGCYPDPIGASNFDKKETDKPKEPKKKGRDLSKQEGKGGRTLEKRLDVRGACSRGEKERERENRPKKGAKRIISDTKTSEKPIKRERIPLRKNRSFTSKKRLSRRGKGLHNLRGGSGNFAQGLSPKK